MRPVMPCVSYSTPIGSRAGPRSLKRLCRSIAGSAFSRSVQISMCSMLEVWRACLRSAERVISTIEPSALTTSALEEAKAEGVVAGQPVHALLREKQHGVELFLLHLAVSRRGGHRIRWVEVQSHHWPPMRSRRSGGRSLLRCGGSRAGRKRTGLRPHRCKVGDSPPYAGVGQPVDRIAVQVEHRVPAMFWTGRRSRRRPDPLRGSARRIPARPRSFPALIQGPSTATIGRAARRGAPSPRPCFRARQSTRLSSRHGRRRSRAFPVGKSTGRSRRSRRRWPIPGLSVTIASAFGRSPGNGSRATITSGE